MARPDKRLQDGRIAVYRHPVVVRVAHWLNVLCLAVLLTSGLQIFNAHPALYFGPASTFDAPALAMGAVETKSGKLAGVTIIAGHTFNTTGLFGASMEGGRISERGFPRWLTLPPGRDLAAARRWHFFFAWGLVLTGAVSVAYGLFGRIRRDLLPTGAELKGIGTSIREHLALRLPEGEEARHYNVLQKLTYLAVLFGLIPLMVLTGLTMSPGVDAALPGLLTVFGGRQTARTIHFIAASILVLFFLVHIVMVLAAGVGNELRSMITGRYVIDVGDARARRRSRR